MFANVFRDTGHARDHHCRFARGDQSGKASLDRAHDDEQRQQARIGVFAGLQALFLAKGFLQQSLVLAGESVKIGPESNDGTPMMIL